jgi:hypothetical protein
LTPLALGAGGIALWTQGRRRARSGGEQDEALLNLTPEEEARVNQLIAAERTAEK